MELPILVLAAAVAATPDDAALCARVADLANRGELAATIVEPAAADGAATARRRSGGELDSAVSGTYLLDLGAGAPTRLFALGAGGSCHWLGLAFEDSDELTLEPLLASEDHFNVDLVPARIGRDWVVLAVSRSRWQFDPIAVARLHADGVVPACRLRGTGAVRRLAAPGDAVCAALAADDVGTVEWTEVARDEGPQVPGVPVEGRHAALDWIGAGSPRKTWLMSYESGAGCGMTYHWLGIDASTDDTVAIDLETPFGRAFFPSVDGQLFDHGPWIVDRVFEHHGRAYLAGQPQWGDTTVGDYAVYRFDADGVHVQCRYRHVPQVAVDVGPR